MNIFLVDLYSAEHEYIFFGCKSSFVFSWILQLHVFFVYFEYIQIFILNLHSTAAYDSRSRIVTPKSQAIQSVGFHILPLYCV